jgi:beta-lactam-binding protein with PASTA domain
MSFERRNTKRSGPLLAGFLRGNVGRAIAFTGTMFVIGYTVSSQWLVPSVDDPMNTEFAQIPDLFGFGLVDAMEMLTELSLSGVVRSQLRHPRVPEGDIIAQSPLPGQVGRNGDTIRLTTSAGPSSRVVPNLVGLGGDDAAGILRHLGFDVDVVRSAEVERAGVIEIRPGPGTRLALPTTIELAVSEGATIVTVPDLHGRHVDDVQAVLEDGQLQLGAIRYQVNAPEGPGRVVSQSPAPSSPLSLDGFVSIVVAGIPPDSVSADLTEEVTPVLPDTTADRLTIQMRIQ